jgi:hypothetical protein
VKFFVSVSLGFFLHDSFSYLVQNSGDTIPLKLVFLTHVLLFDTYSLVTQEWTTIFIVSTQCVKIFLFLCVRVGEAGGSQFVAFLVNQCRIKEKHRRDQPNTTKWGKKKHDGPMVTHTAT